MYVQEITIHIQSADDIEAMEEEFGLLLAHYRQNGQTQGKFESQFLNGTKIVCYPFTHEKDSLSQVYNNFYVNRQSKKIEELCEAQLQFSTVGKAYESYTGACSCDKPSFYILITNYLTIQSPITCGDCNCAVPLYKLPSYYDHGYGPILSWESNYNSCDTLQMNSEIGEQWALNQMQKFNSPLSKQGIDICRRIEKLTQTPTYYYLFHYRKTKMKENSTSCPSCGGKWQLSNQLHRFYDFQCPKCRLLSTVSLNS